MSRQFDRKKEAVALLNKKFNLADTGQSSSKQLTDLQQKNETLSKKLKNFEKIYQFHKGVVQNISSGILTIDNNKNITFINHAALNILGYEFKELVNKPVEILFADKTEGADILNDLLVRQKIFDSKEVNLLSKKGELIPIGFSTTKLKLEKSDYSGVIITFKDISNIRNMRLQMERMDRLATLGEVSAGIAHEIRNPLAGIKTSAQVLEESFHPNDFRAQLVSRIVKEIDRSNELLKKFFKFAKPGKPEPDFTDMARVVEAVHLLLITRLKKKKIQFITEFEEGLPEVFVDEGQMEQVIINLVMNAIDALSNDDKIIKVNVYQDTRMLETSQSSGQAVIVVSIADNGVGIDKQIIEKIFNPFFTTKNDGVGLGLSISNRLAQENRGILEVESEPGKGSTFSLVIPVTRRQDS